MIPQTALLPDGRLHLQQGPIDVICRAWGERFEVNKSYAQAVDAFPAILPELVGELQALRAPLPSAAPDGEIGRAMHAACAPFAEHFITPMAAVAGAVADRVLAAMREGRTLLRAFANDGGDIAFHLAPGQTLRCGVVADIASPGIAGTITLRDTWDVRGIATSGRACKGHGGRSFSLGIADAVTVLARTAAAADAAATIIGNAVDLPGHAAISRWPASAIDPGGDLGDRLVTWEVGALTAAENGAPAHSAAAAATAALRAL